MSGILPILNNYNTNPTHNYTRTMRIIRDHIESYNVRTEILKDDISDIVTFIDSHIKEESFKTNTAELFVRFAETLIIEKHFDEAYEVLSALEGSKGLVSEDSQVEGLIRRLEINSAFLETICAKSVTNPNDWFDFPYSKFLSLKADALKGMKRYSEAIKQYDLALQNGAAGKASDFRPYALVGKYEAEVKTGAVTATNAPQKAAELKRKIETYTGEKVSAKEIDKLNKRIERSLETVNKDFATIDKDIDAEIVASSKPFDKAQLNETKAWNLLNWAKSIAFDNPDASDPKLKCDAKSCPQVDILLKKAEAIIPELTPAVSAEVTKHVNNTKLLFLLKWAEKISATDSKLAFAKVKEAEALIDKTNIEQFAWLVWSYANIAKTGNAEALKKTLELSDKKEDQIDKVSKKGKIKAAIGYAKIECAKNAKGIENIQAALKAAKDYCINNNLGGLYVKCLWEMNTNKEDLQVLKELAAIYKTISGRTLETIKDLQPSPDITFSTDDKIDPQDIAIILDKISTLLKGKQDPSASKYAEAAKTEYKYYLGAFEEQAKNPKATSKDLTTLARIYSSLGKFYTTSSDPTEQELGTEYQNRAGMLYSILLGTSQDETLKFIPKSLDATIRKNASRSSDLFSKQSEEFTLIKTNYALLALELFLRPIKIEKQNAEAIEKKAKSIQSLFASISTENIKDPEILSAISNGQIETARIIDTALILMGKAGETISGLMDNVTSALSAKGNYPEALGGTTILSWAYLKTKQFDKATAVYKALLEGKKDFKVAGTDPRLSQILDLIIKNKDQLLGAITLEGAKTSLDTLKTNYVNTLISAKDIKTASKYFEEIKATLEPTTKALIYLAISANNANDKIKASQLFEASTNIGAPDIEEAIAKVEEFVSKIADKDKKQDAISLLAWVYTIKGDLANNKSDAVKYYLVALKKYEVLPETLERVLAKAGISQALADNIAPSAEKDYLKDAKGYYEKALITIATPKTPEDKTVFMSAHTGLAEVLLQQAQATPSNAKAYIDEATTSIKQALENSGTADEKEIKRILTAILFTLSLTKDLQKAQAVAPLQDGEVFSSQAVSLVLLRIMAKGFNQKDFDEGKWQILYTQATTNNGDTPFDVKALIDLAKGQHILKGDWEQTGSYISGLIDAKLYNEATTEYFSIATQLDDVITGGSLVEKVRAIKIKLSIANMYCYKQENHDGALKIAESVFDSKILSDTFEDKINILIQTYNIKATALSKKGDHKGAVKLLEELLTKNSSELNLELDSDTNIALVRTYLSLGDRYNYEVKDADKALENYKKAEKLTKKIIDPRDIATRRLLFAQVCLGVANVFEQANTPKTDFDKAIVFYDLGIGMFKNIALDNKDNTSLFLNLHRGKAGALTNKGQYEEAETLLNSARAKAEESIRGNKELWDKNALESLNTSLIAITETRAGRQSSLELGFNYGTSTYKGVQGSKGVAWSAKANFKLPENFSLEVKYDELLPVSMRALTTLKDDPIRLKIDAQHKLIPSIRWDKVFGNLRFGVEGSAEMLMARYQVNNLKWLKDYTGVQAQQWNKDFFFALYPTLRFDLDWMATSYMTLGFSAWASIQALHPQSPVEAANNRTVQEFPDAKIEKGSKPSMVSGGGEVDLKFNVPDIHMGNGNNWLRIFPRVGIVGGYNPKDTTVYGIYPYTEQRLATLAIALGLTLDFKLGTKVNLLTALSVLKGIPGLPSKFNDPLNVKGEAGLEWYLNNKVTLKLSVFGEQEQDNRNGYKSKKGGVNVGVGF